MLTGADIIMLLNQLVVYILYMLISPVLFVARFLIFYKLFHISKQLISGTSQHPLQSQKIGMGGNTRIFISGDTSGAGKSTVSLGLLGALLKEYDASEIAYIKPATQGTQATLTAQYCKSKGIACQHVGPLVFYRGFTQKFLDGEESSSEQFLKDIVAAVDRISEGKKVTVVDGVGYASVGSCVGVSNAHVAEVIGAPVLLVLPQGLGDPVDKFNMCSAWFEKHNVGVLGAIINKIDGAGSMKKSKNVVKWFEKFTKGKHV